MIDFSINNDQIKIKRFFHKDDSDFQIEMDTLILMLLMINAYENPKAFEIRMLNNLFMTKEGITHMENALKTKKGDLYEGIRLNKNMIIDLKRRERNENKNFKKKPNDSK